MGARIPAVHCPRTGPVPRSLQGDSSPAEGPHVYPHTEPHMQRQPAGAPRRGTADRFRYARGISKQSLIFRMAMPLRNCIKPLDVACRTPAEAAGMRIRGANKWLTLIQNAVSAARGAANARHDALMRISVQHPPRSGGTCQKPDQGTSGRPARARFGPDCGPDLGCLDHNLSLQKEPFVTSHYIQEITYVGYEGANCGF